MYSECIIVSIQISVNFINFSLFTFLVPIFIIPANAGLSSSISSSSSLPPSLANIDEEAVDLLAVVTLIR